LTYILYNVSLILLHFPLVPLDLVMVSFNLVPAIFPLVQYYFVFHLGGATSALVHIQNVWIVVEETTGENSEYNITT
ncbi:hypothetical protein PENTCL1PPCAC_27114, partial [Pristionchus entomophagus]